MATFVVHTFLAPGSKISQNSMQFSHIDSVNFVTDITFQFFESAWVCLVHSIFQSTPLPKICYTDYGLLNVMEFLHREVVIQRVFVLGCHTKLTNIDHK